MQRFAENKFAKTINTLGVSFVVKEHRGVSLAIWVRMEMKGGRGYCFARKEHELILSA